ncbi:LamG-like jellyroll fold domain-containing protein [Tamlana crocina]|nr:LamG-like jellyroll fold domain-containing protein [Tamlana crocina]
MINLIMKVPNYHLKAAVSFLLYLSLAFTPLKGFTSSIYRNIAMALSSAPEINITGNSNTIIGNGSNTPILTDNTDFGKVQIVSETVTKTFVIENTGAANLTLGNILLSGTTDFSIISKPANGTVISAGNSESITISFATSTEGTQTTVLSIASDDSDEATYQINLTAEGDKVFFDSDNDGVYDDVDIDDDNDGIMDSDEENACRLSNGAWQADYKFLNETFGTGTGRGTGISSLYTVSTSYCLEDGSPGSSCSGSNAGVGDGEYTVTSFITSGVSGETVGPNDAIASWAWYAWAPIEDHTPGDTDGRMAVFNADYDPGIFYETQITGTLANVPVTYSFWVINIDNDDSRFSAGELPRGNPNVTVNFLTLDRSTVIATFDTGDITRCSGAINDPNDPAYDPSDPSFNTCTTSEWKQFTETFSTSETAFIVQFVNNAPGGAGNDLAIDDIEVRQTLCDMDSDGVADVFDLDSDNDGIPDVVEGNPTSASLSEGKASLTGVSSWVDANGNGMHDLAEGISPINSDTDLIPDYLDLDSDNDGLFDIDEYGIVSSSAPLLFQNGDGDVTGNGVGDGAETEAFREKDSEGDGSIEYYGDGILDIFDYHSDAATYADAYGNIGQGTGPLYALDSDGDGTPDYRDPTNGTTNDIDTVEIYAHLPNTAGVLDNTTDADGDGIVASRDGNDTVFGSPRNLDNSYSLYFDGRNDYVEDTNVISSGSATIMAFIKSDGTNTDADNRVIAGQNDFYIRINEADNSVTAISESVSLSSTTNITDGIWTHVAVTTETGGDVVLFINGIEEARDTSSLGGITDASSFMIGRATTDSNYFKGGIDEVRVFNKALTTEELQRMVYQELDDSNNFNSGKIIPITICASLGSNLVKYYKMDGYQDDILDDKKTGSIDVSGAKMYNFKDIYFQKAPLPYETVADGNWTDSANWLYGSEWDITTKTDNPNGASIVHIKNNITLNGAYNEQGMTGLIVDSEKEFSIEGDKGLYNTWYLKLDGLIDLEGESQLIQIQGSVLDPTSSGKIERDQQGTKDFYTYNYWSSPVGVSNTSSNNNSYKMTDNVFKNGTLPTSPSNITFTSSGYNGCVNGNDITVADYWIWKYSNSTYNSYYAWQHVRRNGTILPGEGFTMKGVDNTSGNISLTQNYVFDGKPNNDEITLPLTVNNEYLVGNPYPSALDADEFIRDNIKDGGNNTKNVINGAIYFWEHFASNSHILKEYQGGYGVYTLMGSTPAINSDTRINYTGGLTSTKGAPERYIPVGQGFFVRAILDPELTGESNDPNLTSSIDGGNIVFKNSQRVFQTEASGSSIFLKSNEPKSKKKINNTNLDTRPKLRLMFDSPKGYHRQLLTGVDESATNHFDLGYDAPLTEDNVEDMFWLIHNKEFVIQAVNHFETDQKLPLGVKIKKAGMATIKIEALENITNSLIIYLHDKALDVYHNLKTNDYSIHLDPGTYLDRFEITFGKEESLNTEHNMSEKIGAYFSNEKNSIIVNNPASMYIESVELLNIIGQSVFKTLPKTNQNNLEYYNHLKPGNYILRVRTKHRSMSKKVRVK